MDETLVAESSLTERQVEVLRLREAGHTQQSIGERFGTTASNVSRIERAAERNIEKARRTLELARLVRAPVRFRVDAGTTFEELVETTYERGDAAGVAVDYCVPELYAHLYGRLEGVSERNAVSAPVEVGLTAAGEVKVHPNPDAADGSAES